MITNSSHLLNSAMAHTSREEEKNFKEKVAIYLKLISEATHMLNQNQGSLRRDVWAYLLKIYGKEDNTVDYRDFLHAIRRLLIEGKLLQDQGLFRIEPNTFKEIWEVEKPATPKFSERSFSHTNNPMIPQRQRF